nr:hypothetical protein CFP56_03317 [Quercus suber]
MSRLLYRACSAATLLHIEIEVQSNTEYSTTPRTVNDGVAFNAGYRASSILASIQVINYRECKHISRPMFTMRLPPLDSRRSASRCPTVINATSLKTRRTPYDQGTMQFAPHSWALRVVCAAIIASM